jgi:hypothetical protein
VVPHEAGIPSGRGTKEDVVQVLAAVLDDDVDTGISLDFSQVPTANLVIDTSVGPRGTNRQHVYPFDTPLPPEQAKPVLAALHAAAGGKSGGGTKVLNHPWRLIGCANWPGARKLRDGRSPAPQLVRLHKAPTAWNDVEAMQRVLAPHFHAAIAPPPHAPAGARNVDPAKARRFHERLRDAGYYDAGEDARTRYVHAAKALANDLGDEYGRPIFEEVICWQGVREDEGSPADADEIETRWRDCSNLRPGVRPITHGTLIDEARRLYGWSGADLHLEKDKSFAEMFEGVKVVASPPIAPSIAPDAEKPPGQQGESLLSGAARPPVITIEAGALHKLATGGEQALIAAGIPFYAHADEIQRPIVDEVEASKGRKTSIARLATVTPDMLRDYLSRSARWERYNMRAKGYVPADPPRDVAAIILSREGEWQFPRAVGVITTPTLRPDGTILVREGYDPATRLILMSPPAMPEIPETPTRAVAAAALQFLDDLLGEFPFVVLKEVLMSVALSTGGIDARKLGHWLARKRGRIVDGHKLTSRDDSHNKQRLWYLTPARQ